jgi:hypothetical protein
MHSWGDDTVDWKGINDAARFIARYLIRYGRVSVLGCKEKYGTVRVYCVLGWHQIHSITHPGYAYNQYPDWLWRIDCVYGNRLIALVNWAVVPYHRWLYRRAYKAAIKRWPHLKQEILSDADYDHLLKDL